MSVEERVPEVRYFLPSLDDPYIRNRQLTPADTLEHQ